MSDQAAQRHPNCGEMSGQSTSLRQSPWMGHWLQAKYKRKRDDSPRLQREDGGEIKQHSSSGNYVSEPSGSKSPNGVREVAVRGSAEVMNKSIADGSDLKKERTDSLSFPMFNVQRNGGASSKQVAKSQMGQGGEYNAVSVGTIQPRVASLFGCQIQEKEATPNLELELRSRDSVEGGCLPAVRSSRGNLPGGFPYGILYRKEKVIPFASTSKSHPIYHDFNIETVRISGSLDPREEIHLGLPMYAKANRHFLITEKTAIGVSDEGEIFRESMRSTEFNGNVGGLLSLSAASGQARPGLKLQLLDGSTDSEQIDRGSEEIQKTEGNQSIGRLDSVAGLTNETSAETRTMEVDTSPENNQPYHLAVSRLNQDVSRGQSTASYRGRSPIVELPDMNEDAVAPDGSENEEEPTASRTQSLDIECLLSHADCPSSSKSVPRQVIIPGPEPGIRWVKRLKLNGTKSAALGTKSSTLEESSPSFEKLRKLSSNLLNRSIGVTSSEPTTGTHLRYASESKKMAEASGPSDGGKAGKCGKASSTESLNRAALLSHSWIRRWRHDQTASLKKQPAPAKPAEPSQTLKPAFDQFQKKAFPSIAAMALMGKAMNGFRPCQFTKKGSLIVWNTSSLAHD